MNIVISLFNLSGMDDVSWLHRNDDGSTLNTSDGWQELGNLPSGTAVAAEKKTPLSSERTAITSVITFSYQFLRSCLMFSVS